MTESILTMATELTLAQIQAGQVPPDGMNPVINATFETLMHLKASEPSDPHEPASTVPVNWKRSITKHSVICLECGSIFKQLSTRHLRKHDLDGRTYRRKYSIPREQSLAAHETSARRRAIVQESRPWEKSRTYRKQKKKTVKPSPTKRSRLKKAS